METQRYYRRGFGLREEVQHLLDSDYRSEIVDRIRRDGNVLSVDGLTIRLADEFGFCYGVDRAVDYAFQTREKFPDRRIFITGDLIVSETRCEIRYGRRSGGCPHAPGTSFYR